jgi:hypothetical protein
MRKEKRPMPARSVQKPAPDERPDAYWATVSDLVSLIERTRGHQLVNELAGPGSPDDGDVVVLDDVASDQVSEATLLSDCNLRLREALHFLLEARASRKQRPNAAQVVHGSSAADEFGARMASGE